MKPDEDGSSSQEDITSKLPPLHTYLKAFFLDVIDLSKGVDAKATIKDIKNKRSLSGANSWMLMCSIVIASIGLSQNSQAIIIGAMLISPLMSPILGIGLSVGINDMETLKASFAHFAIAIFIAIFTSYVYFELLPFNELTSEISARTKPTFLDIFVAIFGGFAGIISIARKDISTTLPGVAIATALMPPLCVTGYGLACGNWEMATASFYLFFLNSFFVALATYIIVRVLKFPYREYVDKRTRLINILKISIFSLGIVIPSFFIFREVLYELNLKQNIEAFIADCLKDNAIYLDSYIPDSDSLGNKILYLKVYGNVISKTEKSIYLECLNQHGVKDFDLKIIPSSDVKLDDVNLLKKDLKRITDQLEQSAEDRIDTKKTLSYYESNHIDSTTFDDIKKAIIAFYPDDIAEMGLAAIHISNFIQDKRDVPTLLIKWKVGPGNNVIEDNKKIENYVKKKLLLDTIKVINY